MKNVTVGILAHVDAGKTTLAEAILYRTGALRRAGRVDHGDTAMDAHELERSRGITIFTSQAELTVYFQDGDGDIGFDETDKNPVFAVDSPYDYNFFINLYEKQHGEWVLLDLPTPLHARVPHLSNSVPESIEGKLTILTFINNPYSPYDTVRLTCWLVDRALHHSDTITTPEIIVKK